MRPLEIALLALVALACLRLVIPPWHRSRTWGRALAVPIGAVLVLHAVLEGVRWQLLPAYLAGLGVVLAALGRRAPQAGVAPRVGGALGLLLALVSGVLAWALPVVRLGDLSGDLDVATTSFRLVDQSRDERYTTEPDDARAVVVQAWYPTRRSGAPAPLVEPAWEFGRVAADWLELPSFSLSHLGLIDTRSTEGAEISASAPSYPVIVYSHGWGGFRTVQVDLMEDLASQGFVVLAIDHTYGSLATVFPEGQVVPIQPEALPEDAPPVEYDAAAATLEEVYAADIRLLLDHLETEANATRFGGMLDLTRVGLLGHSTGGGAAVTACARDERCDGVVGLDPWLEPVPEDVLTSGLRVPALAIFSADWVGNESDMLTGRLFGASSAATTRLSIDGTTHRDFTLLPLLSPLAAELGFSGVTPGRRTHEIVEDYVLSFFDATLRQGGGALLDGAPPYPEVRATP